MPALRITVIGAGVIGMSCAHELAVAGHQVTVVAAHSGEDSVSNVAAAVWFPYGTEVSARSLEWAKTTYDRLNVVSHDPMAGVDLRRGTLYDRVADPDLSWTAAVPSFETADPSTLPAGTLGGTTIISPVVTMSIYLPWLRRLCLDVGVRFVSAEVADLGEIPDDGHDLLVVAAGIRSGTLLGDDDTMYPVRGQVVRLKNPGLTEWAIDDDGTGELTYVVPRRDDIVCGGTAQVGDWNPDIVEATETAILERAIRLMPALAGLPIVSRAVGFRPSRPTIRLERVAGRPDVIACYGHGGAGVSLSWGSAAAVTALVALS